MQPQITPGTGNKVMTKAQKKVYNAEMAAKASQNAIIIRDKEWAREIQEYLKKRRESGSKCFP